MKKLIFVFLLLQFSGIKIIAQQPSTLEGKNIKVTSQKFLQLK